MVFLFVLFIALILAGLAADFFVPWLIEPENRKHLVRRTLNVLRYKLGDLFVDFGLYLMHKSNVELRKEQR